MQWPAAITWRRAAACIALLASGLAHAARDVAWIWPGSDLPSGPLQEVAVLVESIEFRGTDLARRPRLRSLVLAPTVAVTPVIHVQSDARSPGSFSAAQREAVLAALSRHADESSSGWIQLDFEAPARQREAYLSLVAAARQRLPTTLKLSVTALASWCRQGGWLDRLAADEVVPMLYRLGPAAEEWKDLWLRSPERLHPRCREAAGFAVQEMPHEKLLQRTTRRYWFHERNWTRVPLASTP